MTTQSYWEKYGGAIKGRMIAENAISNEDCEITRCLKGCVACDMLIETAINARKNELFKWTPETDKAWDSDHPLYSIPDFQQKRDLCANFEEQNAMLKIALKRAAKWGIRSDGFSAEVSDSLRLWVDSGMIKSPPEIPDYYPTN